jgi:hypothetical protein
MPKKALVVTTINPPNTVLTALADGAEANRIPFIIVGDTKSPEKFVLPGAQFIALDEQDKRFPKLSGLIPRGHYARKNVGYLIATQNGVEEIQETDDDNIPLASFWRNSSEREKCEIVRTDNRWFNVYSLFTDELIWPRGFPLQYINQPSRFTLESNGAGAGLIRQGLSNENPDVDAVFRLTRKLPIQFEQRTPVLLPPGLWSPFNSQNTVFRRAAFPLLYLPSCCSFRMTDIWRSLVAQRCLWEMNEGVIFHSPTVYQERNEHSLLRDFEDEISGYLLNDKIRLVLESLTLDATDMFRSVRLCYEALVNEKLIPSEELVILRGWERILKKLL